MKITPERRKREFWPGKKMMAAFLQKGQDLVQTDQYNASKHAKESIQTPSLRVLEATMMLWIQQVTGEPGYDFQQDSAIAYAVISTKEWCWLSGLRSRNRNRSESAVSTGVGVGKIVPTVTPADADKCWSNNFPFLSFLVPPNLQLQPKMVSRKGFL